MTVGDFDNDGGPDIAYPSQGKTLVKTSAMPQTTITSGPADVTNDSTPAFAFSADIPWTTFDCALDERPWEPCASPLTVPPLDVGVHDFRVRAVGFLTDPTPAKRRFTVLPRLSGDPPVAPVPPIPPDGEADNEPALELSVLRTRIPRSASGLVRHGAGGRVRCTADCVVHLKVIARGSAPRRMGFAGPIGRDKVKLPAGKRGKLTAYPPRAIAAKLLNPTASGSLRVELEFNAEPR